jgi:hypothetical protein
MNIISLIYYHPPKPVPNIWIADFEGANILAFAGFGPATPGMEIE